MSRADPGGSKTRPLSRSVQHHYARRGLAAAILSALARAGKDLDALRPEDLAPIDEFHVRGRQATLELARAAGVRGGMRVLDVGSGLGGPSRCLAREFGCRVAGIDLTGEYCRVAAMLAARVGLARLVSYAQADALHLPFRDGAFDVAWSQHASMNIPDKAGLYGEMRRVLKAGGKLAIYDVLAGPRGPVLFPVPWARGPDTSFLVTPGELRRLLETSGFEILNWEDGTEAALAWFAAMRRKTPLEGAPPVGLHLLLGSDFPVMAANLRRNLEERRAVLAQVVARR